MKSQARRKGATTLGNNHLSLRLIHQLGFFSLFVASSLSLSLYISTDLCIIKYLYWLSSLFALTFTSLRVKMRGYPGNKNDSFHCIVCTIRCRLDGSSWDLGLGSNFVTFIFIIFLVWLR
ncbi:hypothetical protein ABFX02_08G092000 [Erythranthe guttata]